MARPAPKYFFIGGPLDGTEDEKNEPGRWSQYLDRYGIPLLTPQRDRMVKAGSGEYYEIDSSMVSYDTRGAEIRHYRFKEIS